MKSLIFLLVGVLCFAVSNAKSVSGDRLLILLDDLADKDLYSRFISSFSDRGFQVTIKAAADKDANLFQYETESLYDHLIFLSPKTDSYSTINPTTLLQFVNSGGNVLVAADSQISATLHSFALEFSVDFDDSSLVYDNFNRGIIENVSDPVFTLTSKNTKLPIFSIPNDKVVYYSGIAQRVSHKNPLVRAAVVGSPTTVSDAMENGVVAEGVTAGSQVRLVSIAQARNNARVLFTGSLDMFSDAFATSDSYNAQFTDQLSKWVLQESSYLRVHQFSHHRANETQQHGIYRIKDDLVLEISVSEYKDDKWIVYDANDIQCQAVMLDPYILKTMSKVKKIQIDDGEAMLYKAEIKLPDRHGVFSLLVDYKRYGLTWLENKEVVEVRPFRHDDYPRFLSAAWVYYVNVFAAMIGWVVVSAVWLFHMDGKKKKTE